MKVILEEPKKTMTNITDYARDIDMLLREEGERIRRILHVIDESMTAIHQSRKILNNY
ncbi:MAG: hypothetical protein WCX65_13615 [bacterium]